MEAAESHRHLHLSCPRRSDTRDALFLTPARARRRRRGDRSRPVMIRIAGSPIGYRLRWLGWQIAAVSGPAARSGARTRRIPAPARKLAIATAAFVVLAVIPDQTAQFLPRHARLRARKDGRGARDTDRLHAFGDAMFPCSPPAGRPSLHARRHRVGAGAARGRHLGRALARLSPPIVLFFAPSRWRRSCRSRSARSPSSSALERPAFTVPEGWFVLVWCTPKPRRRRRRMTCPPRRCRAGSGSEPSRGLRRSSGRDRPGTRSLHGGVRVRPPGSPAAPPSCRGRYRPGA